MTPAPGRSTRAAAPVIALGLALVGLACRTATTHAGSSAPAAASVVAAPSASLVECTAEHANETAGVCPAGQSCSCDWIGMMTDCKCRPVGAMAGCLGPGAACHPPDRCCQLAVLHAPWHCVTPAEEADAGAMLNCPDWDGGSP